MIPFFALIAPNHELPSVWLLTNTIKLSSIPPLIFDAPLLLGISCPLNHYTGEFMIRCDECKEWYHGDCVRITQEETKAMGDFVCSGCHRHPREKV
jgi:hypothetical protein